MSSTDGLSGRVHVSDARGGQSSLEFMVVTAMFVASLAILVVFLFTFKEYGGRILDLAGSEYP